MEQIGEELQTVTLSVEKLKKLVRDFQADCRDGFVSNDEIYINNWLKRNLNE